MSEMKKQFIMTMKIGALLCATTIILSLICISVNFLYMSAFLRDKAGEDQTEMARLIASSVSDKIHRKVELAGGTSLGDIHLDESSDTWKVSVNTEMLDSAGKASYVQKGSINIEDLCAAIADFKLGHTGRAALVDDKAYLAYAPGAKPFSNKFCSYNSLQKALDNTKNWAIMEGIYGYQGPVFASFYQVKNELLTKNNIKWWVFVVRDAHDITSPLREATSKVAIIGVFLALIALLIGAILGKTVSRPISKLESDIDKLSEERDQARDMMKKFSSDLVAALERPYGIIANIRQGLKSIFETMPLPANEKQKEALNVENNNIDTLVKDIDELSDMAKIEAGKFELNKQPIDIKEAIKSVIFIFEPKIRGKGLDLKLNILKSRVDVYADAKRIKQVLSSFLASAVNSTDKGSIEILLKELPDEVQFIITDTGTGSKPVSSQDAGLYIAKAIIKMHDGKTLIENVQGKGSRYFFSLPKHKIDKPVKPA